MWILCLDLYYMIYWDNQVSYSHEKISFKLFCWSLRLVPQPTTQPVIPLNMISNSIHWDSIVIKGWEDIFWLVECLCVWGIWMWVGEEGDFGQEKGTEKRRNGREKIRSRRDLSQFIVISRMYTWIFVVFVDLVDSVEVGDTMNFTRQFNSSKMRWKRRKVGKVWTN